MAEGIEIPISVTGAREAFQAVNDVSGAFGKMAPLFSQLEQGANGFNTEVGALTGAASKLLGVIGTGPGGLVFAMTGLITTFVLTANEAKTASDRMSEFTAAVDANMRKTEEAIAVRQRWNALMAGGGSAQERTSALEVTRQQIADLQNPGFMDMLLTSGMSRDAQLDALRRQEAQLALPVYGSGEETTIETGAMLRPGDPGFEAAAREAGAGNRLARRGGGRSRGDDFNQFISSTASRADFSLGADGDPQSHGLAGRSPLGMNAESIGGIRRTGSGGNAARQSIRDAEQLKAAWGDAYATIQGGAEEAFAALIKGNGEAAKAALAATGDRMVADGTHKLFEGLAMTVVGAPNGPAMMAIGAGEIAFGTGLGAVMQGGAGGAGGGGGRPSAGQSRDDARQSGPTVINVYALNPTAETGRVIEKSTRMAGRKRVS